MELGPLRQNSDTLRIALKLLAAITLTEFGIMALFRLLGIDSGPVWLGLADASLLGVVSSGVVYLWVARPLSRAARQNALFAAVASNLKTGLIVTDPNQKDNPIIAVNSAFARTTGYTKQELLGTNPRFLKGPKSDPEIARRISEAVRSGEGVQAEQLNYRKDGTTFWNEMSISPVRDWHGRLLYFAGLSMDVTARREAEDQARKLAHAVEQSDEAVCIFGCAGDIEFANPAFCRNVGVGSGELIGSSVWRFWEPDQTLLEREILPTLSEGISWTGRHQRSRGDGTIYEALSSITPVRDADGKIVYYVVVHRDISEMIQLEQQLRHSQKMEAVGTLVGGIAHDFNNILAGILGNLYLMKQEIADRPKAVERLKSVEEQGYLAADMIKQLLTFARKENSENKRFDLCIFSKEVVKLCALSVPEDIAFVTDIGSQPMVLRGDPGQIQQIILNLVTNARYAVEERHRQGGGRIELQIKVLDTLHDGAVHAWRMQHPDLEPCKYAHIRVYDNGIGMDAETQQRAFEPFFTSKPKGKGTGLGLAMVQSCIEMHGGVVDVHSTLGESTCFDVYLPLQSDEAEVEILVEDELLAGKGETVLIADDDSNALHTLQEVLMHAGYRVLTSRDGEDAIRKFFSRQDEIRLAILDLVMPKRGGVQAALAMRRSRNDLPVVFMTGYDKDESLQKEWREKEAPTILRKPWDISQLNNALRYIHPIQ